LMVLTKSLGSFPLGSSSQIGSPSIRLILNLIEGFEIDSIHDRIQCRRWTKVLGGKLPGFAPITFKGDRYA